MKNKDNEETNKKRRTPKRVNKARIKTLIGVVLIIAAILGIYYWETIGYKKATYQTVVVFKEDVPAGAVVETNMLGQISYPKDAIIAGAITDYKLILGQTTTGYVAKGAQLVKENFEKTELVVNEGEMVLSIPKSWIYGYPETLRAGDVISLYPVSNVALANADRETYEEKIEYPESWTEDQIKEYEEYNEEPRLVETLVVPEASSEPTISCRVKYVKDSTNREIVDASKNERADGSDNIDTVEVIVTPEQYKTLLQARYDGFVFIIAY